jgi:hypothetical protein
MHYATGYALTYLFGSQLQFQIKSSKKTIITQPKIQGPFGTIKRKTKKKIAETDESV